MPETSLRGRKTRPARRMRKLGVPEAAASPSLLLPIEAAIVIALRNIGGNICKIKHMQNQTESGTAGKKLFPPEIRSIVWKILKYRENASKLFTFVPFPKSKKSNPWRFHWNQKLRKINDQFYLCKEPTSYLVKKTAQRYRNYLSEPIEAFAGLPKSVTNMGVQCIHEKWCEPSDE